MDVPSTSTPDSIDIEVCTAESLASVRAQGEGQREGSETHDLLDNLGRRLDVDETLVDLHLELYGRKRAASVSAGGEGGRKVPDRESRRRAKLQTHVVPGLGTLTARLVGQIESQHAGPCRARERGERGRRPPPR